MKKYIPLLALIAMNISIAQTSQDSIYNNPQLTQNSAQRILSNSLGRKVTLGGYGELTYNQPNGGNGELDVQRMVILVGYNFNDAI